MSKHLEETKKRLDPRAKRGRKALGQEIKRRMSKRRRKK